MRPKRHYLKGNAGTEGPTSLLFFDSESWQPKPVPGTARREMSLRLWVAAHVRREGGTFRPAIYYRGTSAKAFWALVDKLSDWKRPLWAFAHNLGHDLTQLRFWDELETWRFTAGPVERPADPKTLKSRPPWRGRLCLEGRPTFLVVRGRRGTCKLVDTGNYWPSKLASIGEKFGVPKGQMPAWDAPESAWWDYCTRDVDVCRVAVTELLRFWLAEDCGTFQLTAPMLAMQNYRHTAAARSPDGADVNIVLEDDSPARPCERGAYMGGRIEPFYVGAHAGPIYYLDCNSLYPHVMARELYPRARTRRADGCTPKRLWGYLQALGAVADVKINTRASDESYPVKSNGCQVHACGQFWTTLPGPELWRALENGHVDQVGECHLYSLAALFRGWADAWYARKLEAQRARDEGRAELCKLILNSLAGKFGMRGEWWVDAPERAPRKAWGVTFRTDHRKDTTTQYRYVAGHTQKKTPGQEPKNAFPAISAYVCSHAREHMRRAFGVLPARSLLYTATDSIVTTAEGYRALLAAGLVDDERAGAFRLEGTYGECEIRGPNWYRVDDWWTCSGMHGRAELKPDGHYYCDVWDHLPTLLRSNPDGRCGITTYRLKDLVPTQKNEPAGDGWRKPKRFSPDDEFSDSPPRLTHSAVVREF